LRLLGDFHVENEIMKRLLLTGTALVLLVGSASAADLLDEVYVPSAGGGYDWTGFYLGVNAGVGIINTTFSEPNENIAYGSIDYSDWGGTAGVTAGANFQSGSVVWGIEGDLNWSGLGISYYDEYWDSQHDRSWDWFATLRLRGGIAVDNTLFFATAGVAAVGVNYVGTYDPDSYDACNDDNYNFCLSETQFGLAVGMGVEHAVTENISVKLEGLWIGLPTAEVPDGAYPDDYEYLLTSNAMIARAGVNFHF
jgi:outer membrane immunogenic protein